MSSSYVVQNLANGQLGIWEQPQYLLASLFAVPILLVILFLIYRAIRLRSWWPCLGAALCSVALLAPLRALNTGSLLLDRNANRAYFHAPSFFWHDDFSVPLDQIHYADVRSSNQSHYVAVVMKNGDILSFTDATQQPGAGRAAHAINAYVGYTQGE